MLKIVDLHYDTETEVSRHLDVASDAFFGGFRGKGSYLRRDDKINLNFGLYLAFYLNKLI